MCNRGKCECDLNASHVSTLVFLYRSSREMRLALRKTPTNTSRTQHRVITQVNALARGGHPFAPTRGGRIFTIPYCERLNASS